MTKKVIPVLLYCAVFAFFISACSLNSSTRQAALDETSDVVIEETPILMTEEEFKDLVGISELENSDLILKIEDYAKYQGNLVEGTAPTSAKIFIVKISEDNQYSYSNVYFCLPEELRAKSIEELNLLVQEASYYENTGTYSNGLRAYTMYVNLTFIDISSGNIIYRTTLIDYPPPTISTGTGMGNVSNQEIADFIMDFCVYPDN